jgi:hypothetical protein
MLSEMSAFADQGLLPDITYSRIHPSGELIARCIHHSYVKQYMWEENLSGGEGKKCTVSYCTSTTYIEFHKKKTTYIEEKSTKWHMGC